MPNQHTRVVKLLNPSQAPVVYSEDGRTLGGTERIELQHRDLDDVAQRALDAGYLVDESDPESEPHVDPQPVSAKPTALEPDTETVQSDPRVKPVK